MEPQTILQALTLDKALFDLFDVIAEVHLQKFIYKHFPFAYRICIVLHNIKLYIPKIVY